MSWRMMAAASRSSCGSDGSIRGGESAAGCSVVVESDKDAAKLLGARIGSDMIATGVSLELCMVY